MSMIVCGDSLNKKFSEEFAKKLGSSLFYPEITEFPDGEVRARILHPAIQDEVFLLKFFGSGKINQEILITSFVIDALKRSGAKKVTGVFPYFPYVRSDHQEKGGEAVNLEVLARLFEGAGLNSIVTVDPHTVKFPQFFNIPVRVLSAKSLFARQIGQTIKNQPFSLVSPDSGGERLIAPLATIFHHASRVTIHKKRKDNGIVKAEKVVGDVREICVIVDDIIATGSTIREGIDILKKHGGKKFIVFATHGVFSSESNTNLKNSGTIKVYISDTCLPTTYSPKTVDTLSIVDTIVSALF